MLGNPEPKAQDRSFNGAAPARGRKWHPEPNMPSGYSVLQRSRPRAGAEISDPRRPDICSLTASTEPPPRGGGNKHVSSDTKPF